MGPLCLGNVFVNLYSYQTCQSQVKTTSTRCHQLGHQVYLPLGCQHPGIHESAFLFQSLRCRKIWLDTLQDVSASGGWPTDVWGHYKTLQELRMLSSVTLNCQVTKIVWIQVLNCQNCNQCLKCHKSCLCNCQNGKKYNCQKKIQLSKMSTIVKIKKKI